jgi:hypothetical protein
VEWSCFDVLIPINVSGRVPETLRNKEAEIPIQTMLVVLLEDIPNVMVL